LPLGYGGWQTIDGTPQRRFGSIYQTGPASVEATRKGEVGLPYNVAFVFSEVNADAVQWQLDETKECGWRRVKSEKSLYDCYILISLLLLILEFLLF
jgi:transglutaminase 1